AADPRGVARLTGKAGTDPIEMLDPADLAEGGEGRTGRGDTAGDTHDRRIVDRLDAGNDVGDIEELIVDEQMLGELLAARRGALERHQYAGLELRPRPLQLRRIEPVPDAADLLAHRRDQLDDLFRPGAGIDAEDAAVTVAVREGIDRVDEAALLADLLEQARRHAAAERGREYGSGIVVGIGIGETGKAEHDVNLLEV